MKDADIREYEGIYTPEELKEKIVLDDSFKLKIKGYRNEVKDILEGKSKKKLFIVGPCSIHDIDGAMEFASKFKSLSDKVGDKIFLLMRVYLEKPRTALGWKGFINDPYLDGSSNINKGLELSRKLLLDLTKMGVPIATEFLDLLVYPYIEDFVAWGAIGARTSESQSHRQMVSGLNMPVAYKNSTNGNIGVAINAIVSSRSPHNFIGIDDGGEVCKISTRGNPNCHLILRGGITGPNYEKEFVEETQKRLMEEVNNVSLIVDCSHGNSGNDYKNQSVVFRDVVFQMCQNTGIVGVMLESNLHEGNQNLDLNDLKKGVSVTDPCISFEESEKLILESYEAL